MKLKRTFSHALGLGAIKGGVSLHHGGARPPGAMGVRVPFPKPSSCPESPAERSIHLGVVIRTNFNRTQQRGIQVYPLALNKAKW